MSGTARASTACRTCRERKVKCRPPGSGSHPCAKCAAQGSECFYPAARRRRRKSDGRASGSAIEQRLAHMESILHVQRSVGHAQPCTAGYAPSPSPRPNASDASITCRNVDAGPAGSTVERRQHPNEGPSLPGKDAGDATGASQTLRPSHLPTQSRFSDSSTLSRRYGQGVEVPDFRAISFADDEEVVIPLDSDNCWEHHGPGAWVSICSQPGLKWVCGRTGSLDFIDSAKGLIRGWTKRLRFKDDEVMSHRAPEPDEHTAWRYCTAYFEHSYDVVFGVIHRSAFESRLKAHFEARLNAPTTDCPCWFALRNVVYAAGCRCILSKDSSVPFVDAQAQAWRYFENAMSTLRDLLFFPAGLTAVQALALMTLYVEGLGSPALEYMLCSSAVRAAQSKGLHRQPSRSWDLPESEILNRNWLFWAIYCCDKQIAFRSGRPSAIDDDNISCQIPAQVPAGSTSNVEVFGAIVRHAQISSQISKRLMSVKAFHQKSPEFLRSVSDLHRQLIEFRDSLPPLLRPGRSLTISQCAQSPTRITQIFYLHFAYYGSMIATHVLLTYPWTSGRFGTESQPSFRNQINLSSTTVAEAARNIIMNTRSLEVNAATPAFLAFYYPILAHINLFISVLKDSSSSTAESDVALLDTCAGHFGYLDYVTSSELAFPFVKESAALARNTVRRIGERVVDENNDTLSPLGNEPATDGVGTGEMMRSSQNQLSSFEQGFQHEMLEFDAVDFDLESRNLFSAMNFDALNASGFDFFQMA